MKKIFAIFLAAAMSIGLGVNPVSAVVITKTVDFSATDLVKTDPIGGPIASPITSLEGSFTITFDTMSDYNDSSNGIALNKLNVIFTSPIGFSYSSSSSALIVGGSLSGVNKIAGGTNDFVLAIFGFRNSAVQPVGLVAGFCQQATTCFNSRNVSLFVSSTPPGVPETSTWAMMLLGVGVIGAAIRREHRQIFR